MSRTVGIARPVLLAALQAAGFVVPAAAATLGCTKQRVYDLMQGYGIPPRIRPHVNRQYRRPKRGAYRRTAPPREVTLAELGARLGAFRLCPIHRRPLTSLMCRASSGLAHYAEDWLVVDRAGRIVAAADLFEVVFAPGFTPMLPDEVRRAQSSLLARAS